MTGLETFFSMTKVTFGVGLLIMGIKPGAVDPERLCWDENEKTKKKQQTFFGRARTNVFLSVLMCVCVVVFLDGFSRRGSSTR